MDIPTWVLFVCIFLMIMISSVLSAGETAFVAASKAKIQSLAKNGNKRAKTLQNLQKKVERIVGTILLCNNMVNVIASIIASQLFTSLFGDAGVVYAGGFMSVLIVVYAEIVPKFFAIADPVRVALAITPIISFIAKIMHPVVLILEWLAKKSLKLVGVSVSKSAHFSSSLEEIRGAIDMHHSSLSAGDARAMLHSILDLNEVDVDEIMIHRQNVMMIDSQMPTRQILEEVVQSPYTRVPLYQNDRDNIVGILHVKSFLRGLQGSLDNIDTVDVISIAHKPWFIPETTTLGEQLQAFRQKKEHFAVVVDEYGVFMGIVTLEDIVEEIVGDISDELDLNLSGVWTMKNGDIVVVGSTTIRDLNRQFSWDLPDEDAATMAGLILHETRSVPKVGQKFYIEGLHIKVMRRIKNQITLIRITPNAKSVD